MWASLAVILVTAILMRALFYSRRGLPPGPMGLPIIGNLHMLGPLTHQSMAKMAKKYGPLMYLRLGSVEAVVATSAEMATQLLKKNGGVFINRPSSVASEIIAYNASSIAFAADNVYWREARKLAISLMFTPKRIEFFQGVRREEAFEFVKSIWEASQDQSKAFSINPYVANFAASNISRMAFNKKYVGDPHEFRNMIFEVFYLLGVFNIGDFIPWLKWLDLQGYNRRMIRVMKRFDDLMEKVVDDHIKQNAMGPKDEKDRDLVDVLLMVSQNMESNIQFTRENIKAIGSDMFNGGVDTQTVTTEWAMSELVKNPRVLKKLQEEIATTVGKDRRVDELDLPNLKYLQCVVKETFRRHPPSPLLIPRESVEECTIGKYRIPPQTRGLVNVWAIFKDPSVWENPLEFIPERFENKEIDPYGQYMDLIPGGAGRRICPAIVLGTTMFTLMLANLVHSFDWKLPPPLQPETLDMSKRTGLSSPRKEPLLLIATTCLASHNYTKS